jgi:Tfp pilus assembly protein PilO
MSNIISIILLIASVGLFTLYTNPLYSGDTGSESFAKKSVKELRSEEVQYSEALGKTKQIELVHGGLLSKFNSIPDEDRALIAKLLPDHVDTVRLIIDINAIASKNNLTLRNISLSDSSDPKKKDAAVAQTIGPDNSKYESIAVSFGVTGTYDDFLSFVKDVEQSLRVVDIRSLNFSPAQDGNYKYEVSVSTYRLK